MRTTLFFCSVLALGLSSSLHAQRVGGGLVKTQSWYGVSTGDLFGLAITKLDDLDGDGVLDIGIGAPGVDSGGVDNVGYAEIRSSDSGALLASFNGSGGTSFENFGQGFAGMADMNGDGIGDYAIGAPGLGDGVVYLYSGADHTMLQTVSAPITAVDFGEQIASLGDVNGDGVHDYLVGAPDSSSAGMTRCGGVFVISGLDGSVIRTHYGTSSYDYLGDTLANLGDLDLDGVPDYGSATTGSDPGGLTSAGSAWAWSGATGSLIHEWHGTTDYQYFGWAIGSAGDADADGIPDVAVGSPLEDPISLDEGIVRVYSGATGFLLWSWHPTKEIEHAGKDLDTIGDLNLDGHDDLLVGADGWAWGGRVYLLSGLDGSLLHICESEGWSHDMGAKVRGLGDIDGDGELEALATASSAWNNGPTPGGVYLYTYSPFMTADTNTISAAAGGTVTLSLDFPADTINSASYHYYGLLASGTGTGPTTLAGWTVPLTPDGLFAQTLADSYPPQVSAGRDLLDADGDGSILISFAPGSASSLINSTYYLCVLHYEAPPWETLVGGPSLAVPLTILP